MEYNLQITHIMITKLFKMKFHQLHQHLLPMELKPNKKKEIETYQLPKPLNQHRKTNNQTQTELSDII